MQRKCLLALALLSTLGLPAPSKPESVATTNTSPQAWISSQSPLLQAAQELGLGSTPESIISILYSKPWLRVGSVEILPNGEDRVLTITRSNDDCLPQGVMLLCSMIRVLFSNNNSGESTSQQIEAFEQASLVDFSTQTFFQAAKIIFGENIQSNIWAENVRGVPLIVWRQIWINPSMPSTFVQLLARRNLHNDEDPGFFRALPFDAASGIGLIISSRNSN
nr:hypothetical protein [uncultured Roseococcus sp.]